ncbi:MAG: MoxR family ATPase [Candidatus Firestonebacteria bacterium]|nr:MoxR family ATPase [Candidatus Firestonebacteria bacterium]
MLENHELDAVGKQMSETLRRIQSESAKVMVGQPLMIRGLLMGLLTQGHILLEGVPGLAKTLAVVTLSTCIQARFSRIQFTPDLLPSDIIGTNIYNAKTGEFTIKKGPIFANIVLADEINRAAAKVQAALLEAMQEKQVTIGGQTFKLEAPFLVLATQNPLESEGTYSLPDAQLDRFMFKVRIGYPTVEDEVEIVNRFTKGENPIAGPICTPADIITARKIINAIFIDDKIKRYIVDIVQCTRFPERYGMKIKNLIQNGAGPRASLNFTTGAKGNAFMEGRGFVTPDDVKAIAHDVLRHRIIVSYEAEAEEISTENIVDEILKAVKVP